MTYTTPELFALHRNSSDAVAPYDMETYEECLIRMAALVPETTDKGFRNFLLAFISDKPASLSDANDGIMSVVSVKTDDFVVLAFLILTNSLPFYALDADTLFRVGYACSGVPGGLPRDNLLVRALAILDGHATN